MVLQFQPPQFYDKIDNLKIEIEEVKRQGKEKIKYLNIPCSFDIETSSFYNPDKVSLMYVWQFGIGEHSYYGRTWEQFLYFLNVLINRYDLSDSKRMIVYVHNLSFEFQFFRKYFKWKNVFALHERDVLFAVTDNGIEFRCSYLLSGYSLEHLAEQLHEHDVKKLVGNLDYSVIRTPLTKLTQEELDYCINDIRVVNAYIQECINTEGDIAKIPYTKTGYVRRYVRNECFYVDNTHRGNENNIKFKNYQRMINGLWLEPEEYVLLKQAFMGGFTHGSHNHVGRTIENVASYDFTSSYPAVMMYEKYPMGKGIKINVDDIDENDFNFYLKKYCCLLTIEISNLHSKLDFEHPLSSSKVAYKKNYIEDNGRIVKLDYGIITITEVDFKIYREFYNFNYKVMTMWVYEKDFLPIDFVKAICKLYKDKTELKNVVGQEVTYQIIKGMLNACYGMCVTDIVREEITYDEDWSKNPPDLNEQIKKYNHDKKRFLSYPWGVWITAYARRNLFDGIKELGEDYIYADTDSVKFMNKEKHLKYFENYNNNIKEKLMLISKIRNIDFGMFNPKNKLIGVWDDEGVYKKFKTLGAKRYLVQKQDDSYKLTMSGVVSKKALKYMISIGDPFEVFEDDLLIPGDYTGKLTHTYLDEEQTGEIDGYKYKVLSCVHLEPATFEIGISELFKKYLLGIMEVRK